MKVTIKLEFDDTVYNLFTDHGYKNVTDLLPYADTFSMDELNKFINFFSNMDLSTEQMFGVDSPILLDKLETIKDIQNAKCSTVINTIEDMKAIGEKWFD